MLRLCLAVLALVSASVASAQSFPKPPDVRAYVPVTPVFTTDGTANVERDVNVTPPPAYSYELTNIPIPSTTNRIGVGATGSDFCAINTTTCTQAKFRTHVDFSHMLPDDPIRNFGQPGQSHLHCFFGNGTTNAYSTYKSLRQQALTSTAVGTDANGTGYWYPCPIKVNPFGDGKNYAIKANYIIVYYTSNEPQLMYRAAHLVAGLRYVFGYEMDDDFAWLQSILTGYNNTIGHTRYRLSQYSSSSFKMGTQAYYVCVGATATTPYLSGVPSSAQYIVNPDGSDPYNGTCNSNQDFYIVIDGSDCWDGTNLWSPGGYKHLIPRIYDADKGQVVCPTNYYRVPSLELEIHFTQNGWTDRQKWELSSDLAKRGGVPFTAGAAFPPGSTFHTDWMNGWDQDILLKWNHNCLGVDNSVPHQCAVSAISATERLVGAYVDSTGGAGGRNPQVSTTAEPHNNAGDSGFMLVPPAWNGSLGGMKMCHGLGNTSNNTPAGPC